MFTKIEFYEDGSIKSIEFADSASMRDMEFWLRVAHNWSGNRAVALKLLADRVAPTETASNG